MWRSGTNAAQELINFVNKIHTSKNTISILGFYEGVDTITAEQKKNNNRICSPEAVKKLTGVQALMCEPGLDFYTQTGLRPTLQVTGFKSGYISEGYANIVPANAEVRLNIRLVSSQKSKIILAHVKKFVTANTPKYLKATISIDHLSDPVKIDTNSPKVREVKDLLKKSYGKDQIIKYVGGGIPIVKDFQDIFGIDTLLVSLGNDDCNMHGTDENFKIDLLKKGLVFSKAFFSK